MAEQCFEAFYGARKRTKRAVVRAHVSPGDRPQEIFTPELVLQVLYRAWGAIRLDPCGHPESIVRAEETWTGHLVDTGRKRQDGTIVTEWAGPGLLHPWPDRTYWNPPFCDLDQWLEHAAAQPGRWCGLFPARTHRGPDVAVVAAATPPELGAWTKPLQAL